MIIGVIVSFNIVLVAAMLFVGTDQHRVSSDDLLWRPQAVPAHRQVAVRAASDAAIIPFRPRPELSLEEARRAHPAYSTSL